MRLLYLNPNATETMTAGIAAVARAAAPEAEILGWTNAAGPPAIQGPEDGAAALPGLLGAGLAHALAVQADVAVIACADDVGLAELRAVAPFPVLGLAQSAFHMAGLLGTRFSVVTTLAPSLPVIAENVRSYGFEAQCAGLHASGIPVLELDAAAPATVARLGQAIVTAAAQDRSGAVVLGCAGMAPLLPELQRMVGAKGPRLIDGVAASAWLAAAVARAVAV